MTRASASMASSRVTLKASHSASAIVTGPGWLPAVLAPIAIANAAKSSPTVTKASATDRSRSQRRR